MRSSRPSLLAAVLSACALLIAGCGGGEATSTPRPIPTATPTPAPTQPPPTATRPPSPSPTAVPGATVPTPIVRDGKSGGVLQVRTYSNLNTWNVYDTLGSTDWRFVALMFNNLVMTDPYNEAVLVGDLAESWGVSADGTRYTFTLRPGVNWHDGKPVTAADIVYNLQRARALNPQPATATALRADMNGVTNVEQIDPLTVRVTLDQPHASFLTRLGKQLFAMYPGHLPFPDQYAAYAASPIGSGPFKFQELKKDERVVFLRSGGYFKKGLPYLDGVQWNYIAASAQTNAIAALRTGKSMVVVSEGSLVPPILDSLKRDLGFVPVTSSAGRTDLVLNNKPPFSDIRVRQAMSMGLDRQLVVDAWLKGAGNAFASPLLPVDLGGKWGISTTEMAKRPGFPRPDQDAAAKAQALLKQAGVNPADVSIRYLGIEFFKDQGADEAIAQALGRIGFKVSVNFVPTAQQTQDLINGNFDVVHQVRSITIDDPLDNGGVQTVLTTNPLNYGKWSDPEFDRLVNEQERTLDPVKRRTMIIDIQNRFLDDAFAIPVLYRDHIGGALGYVRNHPKHASPFSNIHRYEQVWLDR